MSRSEAETPAEPSRALTAAEPPGRARPAPARPLATFLVQLIDGPAGHLRPSRQRRSREASERYAAEAKRTG
ncbi:hypothetical protein [Methylobacterium nodulans]|uniref:Uncharacterized protein n=1 Tax=Methylobacterium nodulans (strain LMG 21967 / CNCM I-2342 / ORS 2060) TaxID=460265 RepID=B8ISU8_METNO|nr:hypothetical protein [Methylobacterium nodulans]ACL60747.1 conserved hypothetical protein [Methylobacterium nodulans ORS 2060]